MDPKTVLNAWQARLTGVRFKPGTPQSDDDIERLEKRVGCCFPDDYSAFLATFGGLRIEADTRWMYGRLCVRGVDVEGGEILAGQTELADDCKEWSRDPLEGYTPFLGYWDRGVEDGYAFDSNGLIYSIYRGTVDLVEGVTFTDLLEQQLSLLEDALREAAEKEATRGTVIAELASRFGDAAEVRDGQLFVRRNDGVEVHVKLGDGREFQHGARVRHPRRPPQLLGQQ